MNASSLANQALRHVAGDSVAQIGERIPQVGSQLSHLISANGESHRLFAELVEKLRSVTPQLNSENSPAKGPQAPIEYMVPLADQLRDQANLVDLLNQSLRQLIDAIEL